MRATNVSGNIFPRLARPELVNSIVKHFGAAIKFETFPGFWFTFPVFLVLFCKPDVERPRQKSPKLLTKALERQQKDTR